METTTFFSQGAGLAANIYVPEERRKGQLLSAVVVTGSWLTVKEQMPTNYAPLLAQQGLIAMTFDFRGFGTSEGSPREVESPRGKVEDLRNAIAYLQSREDVDPGCVGLLAICASAGYAAVASLEEPAIRSIAMIAPWLHDASIVRELYGGEEGVQTRLRKAAEARRRYVRTNGDVDYIPAASNTDHNAAMFFEGDTLDYYLNPKRGAVPQWGGRFALMAWTEWLRFDPVAAAGRIDVPVHIVTSKTSATPGGTEKFAASLRAPHDVDWIEGTQFDFYDNPETVRIAAQRAANHFEKTLRIR